jgi:hypothetical protein
MRNTMTEPHVAFRPGAAGALTAATVLTLTALTLTGCNPQAASGNGATSASVGSGSGPVSYFPARLGDTWAYRLTSGGKSVTIHDRTVSLTHVSGGTAVTLAMTSVVGGKTTNSTFQYIVYANGEIGVPVSLGASGENGASAENGITVTGNYWPSPAKLASGQPVNETPKASIRLTGQTVQVPEHAVVKGVGTQTVTVPAGTYTATVVDEQLTANILGEPETTQTKIWLVNGIGPVEQQQTVRLMGTTLTTSQELTSFTKG